MNDQGIHEISIGRLSFICWVIRVIHYVVFLYGTSVVPVAVCLLIWQLAKGEPVSFFQIACAALGPWLLVYCFGRLSTLRRVASWQLAVLTIASAAAFAYAYTLYDRMPSSETDRPGILDAYSFLAIAGVLLPIQSALQWWLQQTRLAALGTTIGAVIDQPASSATAARSMSPIKGYLFAAFGLAFLAIQTLAELAATILERGSNGIFFLIGLALLLRSRRYFQTDADQLLAVDRRPPILLLRSFADDAKGGWRVILSFPRLFDYSLELRLARYFLNFGPFVAVGRPNEALPQIGAARKSFDDGEWQEAVLAWAKSAQLIAIFVGPTNWVNWEVSQVISLNLTDRLILLMPESRFWLPWKHSTAMQQRLAMLVQVTASTPWSAPVSQVTGARSIRAILLGRDGSITIVRSRLRRRDSYHLAAMIAHRLILGQVNAPHQGRQPMAGSVEPV